ncbi:MAG: hypothetical protein M1830_001163 [Pleopsidium flavum]|nr:MAG: hypothetical protein M1830_001163 [Pleopsidium flavum]
MVKADVTRNYYADLQVNPAASADDIKKQFKKLDRNPGKEAEFNSRFQAIQSAHEVLADQQQRAKYDSDRIKAGAFTSYSTPTRPNMPPRAPNTNFPPPPPRPPPPSANKSAYPTTPPSGANRYTRYARAEGTKYGPGQDDSQARMNAFRAWEQMNHAQSPKGNRMPPKPPRPFGEYNYRSGREASNNIPKESTPKMRPGWEQFQETNADGPNLNRASTTRTPRKQGFAPGTPGGDEPAARNASAYFNVMRGERRYPGGAQPQFESPLSGSTPTMKKPDPMGRFRSQSGDEDPSRAAKERISTPYATSGGERTYLSSSGLGRSASTREPQKWKEWNAPPPTNYRSPESQTSSGRHHSASPKMKSAHRQRSLSVSSTSSSTSSEDSVRIGSEEAFYASAKKAHGARPARAADVNGEGHRRPSNQPFVDLDDHQAKGVGETPPKAMPNLFRNTRNAWCQQEEAIKHAAFPNGTTDDPNERSQHLKEREAHHTRPSQAEPTVANAPNSSPWHREEPQHPLKKSGSWHENQQKDSMNGSGTWEKTDKPTMYEYPGLSPSFISSSAKCSEQWPCKSQKKPQSPPTGTPYWAIPSSVWPKKPIAVQEEYRNPTQWNRKTTDPSFNRANKMPNTSFTFPTENQPFSDMPPISKDFESHSSENINTTFSPTEWSGKFTGNAAEYFGPIPGKADHAARSKGSPTRGRHTGRIPLQEGEQQGGMPQIPPTKVPVQSSSLGQAKFSPEEWAQIFKEQKWAFPPPPPPLSPNRQSNFKRPKTPRKQSRSTNKRPAVPKPASVRATVDDSGEEVVGDGTGSNVESLSSHTSVDGNAMDIDPTFTPPGDQSRPIANNLTPKPTESTPKQCSQHGSGPPVPPRDTGTRLDQEDASDLNLGNLKNVAPFIPGNDGLKDLGDLSNTLPFESRPAARTNSLTPRRLALPNPPKAPDTLDKLNQNAWERYLAQMRAYMFEWNGYNRKMLAHFNDRQREVENGLAPEWMSAVGEGSGDKGGYGKYMQGVEEDFRVRAHWDVSWEKHRECLRGLGKFSTTTPQQYNNGALFHLNSKPTVRLIHHHNYFPTATDVLTPFAEAKPVWRNGILHTTQAPPLDALPAHMSTGEVHRLIAPRDQKYQSNFVEFRQNKIVYRRYAGLFFCACVDANDNELAYLEAIHFFVEVLDSFFGNVCELDLVFNFYKVYAILDEVFLAGEIEETSKQVVLTRLEHLDKLE